MSKLTVTVPYRFRATAVQLKHFTFWCDASGLSMIDHVQEWLDEGSLVEDEMAVFSSYYAVVGVVLTWSNGDERLFAEDLAEIRTASEFRSAVRTSLSLWDEPMRKPLLECVSAALEMDVPRLKRAFKRAERIAAKLER